MDANLRYLGKKGEVFGPFTDTDLEKLRASGEIESYSWIWEPKEKAWMPLDPPPAPIESTSTSKRFQKRSIEAIAFDYRFAVAGILDSVSDVGCTLRTQDHSDSPKLSQNGWITMNLLDTKSGNSMNIRAKLAQAQLEPQSGWTYQVRWEKAPDL